MKIKLRNLTFVPALMLAMQAAAATPTPTSTPSAVPTATQPATPSPTPTIANGPFVSKSADTLVASQGGQVTYTLNWSYVGGATQNTFEVMDTLPAEAQFSSYSIPSGLSPTSFSISGGGFGNPTLVSWQWAGAGIMPAGLSGEISVVTNTMGALGSSFSNQASAIAALPGNGSYSSNSVLVSFVTATPSLTPILSNTLTATVTPSATPTQTPFPAALLSQTKTPTPLPLTPVAGGHDPGHHGTFCYPDPIRRGPGHFVFWMAGPGHSHIRIYQASASQVGGYSQDFADGGVKEVTLSLDGYAPGVYFYVVDRHCGSGITDTTSMQKFIITR